MGDHAHGAPSTGGGKDRIADVAGGGENVYPAEIEAVLLGHPAVAEAAVVGVADRFWGEVVGAAIRTAAETPPTEAELSEFCGGRLAAYKIPARWLFTGSFPLTASGKVRKDVLSTQFADMPGPAGQAASARRVPAEALQP